MGSWESPPVKTHPPLSCRDDRWSLEGPSRFTRGSLEGPSIFHRAPLEAYSSDAQGTLNFEFLNEVHQNGWRLNIKIIFWFIKENPGHFFSKIKNFSLFSWKYLCRIRKVLIGTTPYFFLSLYTYHPPPYVAIFWNWKIT